MTDSFPFELTRQQRNFFDTFGYLVLPGALKDQIADISASFNSLYENENQDVVDWVHEAHYMKTRKMMLQFIERLPELATLLDNPVINGVFSTLLGEDFIYRGSEANVFSGDTYWHSDLYGAFLKYRHVKVVLYLEPLDKNNGAFRAIPGSHLFGDKFANFCERDVWKHEEKLGLGKDEVPCVVIPTQPGDAVFFDFRLKHATSNTQHNRRMLSIAASQRFADEHLPKLAELTQNYLHMTGGHAYRPEFVATATDSQRRHIDQVLDAFQLIQAGKAGNPVA
jgi:ectoine hydroxylase-related dioxygenase (phytanoyl-CoA dioxygenase family)